MLCDQPLDNSVKKTTSVNLETRMPPIKFKPTERLYDRRTDKHSIVHHYMKATAKKDLFDYLNSSNATPKKTHKVLKELQRRRIKVTWT